MERRDTAEEVRATVMELAALAESGLTCGS